MVKGVKWVNEKWSILGQNSRCQCGRPVVESGWKSYGMVATVESHQKRQNHKNLGKLGLPDLVQHPASWISRQKEPYKGSQILIPLSARPLGWDWNWSGTITGLEQVRTTQVPEPAEHQGGPQSGRPGWCPRDQFVNRPKTTPSWLSKSSKLTSRQVEHDWTTSSIPLSHGQAKSVAKSVKNIIRAISFVF